MIGRKRARMVETPGGYDFHGSFWDMLMMMACFIHTLEKKGFAVEELKHALLFLEKPAQEDAKVWQKAQLQVREFLNGEAREV